MSGGSRLRGTLAGLSAMLFGLVLVAVLLEIGLRVYAAIEPNVDVEFTRYARAMKAHTDSGVRFLHEANAHGRFFGVDVDTNSHGFRDVEIPAEKSPGEVRLGVLGDSVTFGWGVPYGQRFTELLEEKWSAATGRPFVLVNTGHGNYNSVQELAMLREHLAGQPLDGLLQFWYINDAEPTPEYRSPPWFARSRLAVFLWGKADLLRRRAGAAATFVDYYRDLYDETAPGWPAFRDAIRGTGDTARERGLPWVFVILPEFHGFAADGPFRDVYDRVARLAADAGAIVVRVEPAFGDVDPATIRVATNDVHPNARGHAIIARAVAEAVDPRLWTEDER
ncbi:MAG: SGNH/GDSL hydrolase family protein [bacterium]